MRSQPTAALATHLAADGAPYASLAPIACAYDGAPVLLMSTLAEHTKNILKASRAALLFDGTAGRDDPLTGPRATVMGAIADTADTADRARYLARHPGAAMYADFGDFAFYRMTVDKVHLVAGFGQIAWFSASEFLFDTTGADALADAEAEIVAHMNDDHADAIGLYATALAGRDAGAWRMTGIDPEGADLRCGPDTARVGFDTPVATPDGARAALIALVDRARNIVG